MLSKLKLTFLLLLVTLTTFSQDLLKSKRESHYTYVYNISTQEAESIYRDGIEIVDSTFFHSLVDSFTIQTEVKLSIGHYLFTSANKNRQEIELYSEEGIDAYVLNNDKDLLIQVYDLKGDIVSEAEVVVNRQKLRYDEERKAFFDKKSNKKGIVKVTYQGYSSFINLKKDLKNSTFKRGFRKVVYGTPLKYIYLPIRYIVHLPIDGVKSIVRHYPTGVIYRTKSFFVRNYNKVACLFNSGNCNKYYKNKNKGYLTFSKPKYKPNETVKFKAFIVNNKSGKPYDKPLNVFIVRYSKEKKLGEIMPYDKGGYTYEFPLVDSLDLKLDYLYEIELRDEKDQTIISEWFNYEEYELGKNVLHVRADQTEHYRGKDIKLYIKGTDENNLNLMDAKVEIMLKPKKISKYYDDSVFVSNTLLEFEKVLSPKGETEIILSDSLFPKASFNYQVDILMKTSDNEVKSHKEKIEYRYQFEDVVSKLDQDTLQLSYLKNGCKIQMEGRFFGVDAFGNKTLEKEGRLPCKLPFSPYYSEYYVQVDSFEKYISIQKLSPSLQVYTSRTADSLEVKVMNPRKIPFNYSFYKKNTEKEVGFCDSLWLKKEAKDNHNYYFSVNYLWGGEVRKENYIISVEDYKLNLDVKVPQLVSPGQKTTVEVMVTDQKGKAVEGVDITAYGITNKFKYRQSTPPSFKKKKKQKSLINNFSLDHSFDLSHDIPLNYVTWKTLAQLDSIPYYQFLYPEEGIYKVSYPAKESITQFTPYVVHKGNIEPIQVVYVDNVPVYFAWSTIPQAYAINIWSGKHDLRFRTENHEIYIKNFVFKVGEKMIMSVDRSASLQNVTVVDKDSDYSKKEIALWSKYTLPYKNTFKNYAYLEKASSYFFLNHFNYKKEYNLLGPIQGNVQLTVIDDYQHNFQFESGYKYEFTEQLIKMKEFKLEDENLYIRKTIPDFYDEVLTKDQIKENWKSYLEAKRRKKAIYYNPSYTRSGKGRLEVAFERGKEKKVLMPLNKLLLKLGDPSFVRVYPGNTKKFHDLDSGYYQLIYFYSENRYTLEDSLKVEVEGINHYIFDVPKAFKSDAFGQKVSEIIEKSLFQKRKRNDEMEDDYQEIRNSYQENFTYTGVGNEFFGVVLDKSDNQPIPGVNVIVEGTNYGTITNLEGEFSIKAPKNRDVLRFSFIGYKDKIIISDGGSLEVSLELEYEHLDEVIVIGYGTQTKNALASSVSVVSEGMILQGRVTGVQITGQIGSSSSIKIRGGSSIDAGKEPLYVVNGKIYNGDEYEIDPNLITNMTILKDANATSIYGARGVNGVVIIEMSSEALQKLGLNLGGNAEMSEEFLTQAKNKNTLRSNFHDDAFWQPQLKSDQNGKVSFEVTFPDDITKWDTYFLAMNGKKQSGMLQKSIKSYMPLAGQLNLPRFLVSSDTATAIGKSLNYMGDTLNTSISFSVDQEEKWNKKVEITAAHIDSLTFTSTDDSVSLRYTVTSESGFFDGEERTIPVYPLGVELAKGSFYNLDKDTTIHLKSGDGSTKIYAKSNYREILEEEINHVIRYHYLCNEQLASKLKAHLSAYSISLLREEKYHDSGEINKLIDKLSKKVNHENLWGWWEGNNTSYWISIHVIEALLKAQSLGFEIAIQPTELIENLLVAFQSQKYEASKLRILQLIYLLHPEGNYQHLITALEKKNNPSLHYQLQLIYLKQIAGVEVALDQIQSYENETMFGNLYYNEEDKLQLFRNPILDNTTQNTLLVYKIYKQDSLHNYDQKLLKMRNYLLEKRDNGYWINTYSSAQIIETLLVDVMGEDGKETPPQLEIRGNTQQKITEFPFEMDLKEGEEVTITKTGDYPVYLTQYVRYWEANPQLKDDVFEIKTYFEEHENNLLEAGEEVMMMVEVNVKKEADYVMVNVPIPAGCSYASKNNRSYIEVHREYFKNETAIFCKKLRKGKYTFKIALLPRYTGHYHLNPAKAELMYFPTFYGNNELKKIKIE